MNFDLVHGQEIRIMWSNRDPSIRRSGVGNIFVKNLDKSIDSKALANTFSGFGKILSSMIAQNEDGSSKGYGYVHFETQQAAANAIQKVNGMLLNSKEVFVGQFIPYSKRSKELGARKFTNLYVKNFGEDMNNEKLFEMFSEYGTVTSHKVVYNEKGKNMGFGFVNYEEAAQAELAIEKFNEKEVKNEKGEKIYVGRAQKKAVRKAELKKRYAQDIAPSVEKQGVNLYIKNLESAIDDERLRELFAVYGNITGVKVMRDEKERSRGFGFVCFNLPEEATRAVTEMNGYILLNKPLYVALAQKREDRKTQLASQYFDRTAHYKMRNQRLYETPSYYPPSFPSVSGNTFMQVGS